jgi:hypothetical protein
MVLQQLRENFIVLVSMRKDLAPNDAKALLQRSYALLADLKCAYALMDLSLASNAALRVELEGNLSGMETALAKQAAEVALVVAAKSQAVAKPAVDVSMSDVVAAGVFTAPVSAPAVEPASKSDNYAGLDETEGFVAATAALPEATASEPTPVDFDVEMSDVDLSVDASLTAWRR